MEKTDYAGLALFVGSARDATLDNKHFRLVPHRHDESNDDEDSWGWKLQEWENNEEGHKLLSSTIVL